MFDPALFLAFIAAAAILTITPGVDTAMVLRAAAIEGPRSALFASIGISIGCLIWAGAVSLGLGALLQASELAYTILKWIGAAYLLWLGLKLLSKPRAAWADEGNTAPKGFAAMRAGFFTNVTNPKVGVFYVTFLPQFIPTGANVAAYSFLLALVHIALSVICSPRSSPPPSRLVVRSAVRTSLRCSTVSPAASSLHLACGSPYPAAECDLAENTNRHRLFQRAGLHRTSIVNTRSRQRIWFERQ